MAVITICTPTTLPTFSEMKAAFAEVFEVPNIDLTLPPMPTLPWPPDPSHREFNLEVVMAIGEMIVNQVLSVLLAIIEPILDFLGGLIDDLIPKMLFFLLSLLDLIRIPDFSKIIQAIKDIIAKFPPRLNLPFRFPNFSLIFPTIPDPLWPSVDRPGISILQIFQLAVRSFMNAIIQIIAGLINKILDILDIDLSFILALLPTIEAILKAIMLAVGAVLGRIINTVTALMAALGELYRKIKNFVLSLKFPGFPSIHIPLPITFGSNNPEFDLIELLKNIFMELINSLIQKILDFIDAVLSFILSIELPRICIPVITIPALPKIAIPKPPVDIPNIAIPNPPVTIPTT